MSGVIKCPNCKTPIFASSEMVGQVMACPTCQRPIQLVGQQQQAGSPAEPKPVLGSAQEHRLPKAAALAGPLTLEAAPASPKFSVETTQLELRPGPIERRTERQDSVSAVTVITWAAIALLVLGSGVVVVVAGFTGLARDPENYKPVAIASAPKPPPPPAPAPRASGPTASKVAAEEDNDNDSQAGDVRPAPAPRSSPVPTDFSKLQPVRSSSPPVTGLPVPAAPIQSDQPKAATSPTAPAAATAPMPPPPPTTPSPLDGLESFWRLPPAISKNEEPVGSLSLDATEPINLALSSTAAAIATQAAIFAQRGEPTGTWTILYVADLQKPDNKTPLATLRLVGRQFSFSWATLELAQLRQQVANCRVEVHHGEQKKVIQLRAPQQEAALVLELDRDVQIREFAIPDMPKTELLKLEIAGLDDFVGEPKATLPAILLAKSTTIVFKEPLGAEIEVEFRKQPTGSLAVRLEPKFQEGKSKTFELTLKRLEDMESNVTRALRQAETALPREKRELAAKQTALRRLQGSQPSNPLEVPRWKQAVSDAANDVDRTSRNVASLSQKIPEYKARLEAAPKMREFLTSLHQKATIRLRVIAECGDSDLVLVDATKPAGAGTAENAAVSPGSE